MGTIRLGNHKIRTPAVCASISGKNEMKIMRGLKAAKKLGADLAEIRADFAGRELKLERILPAEMPIVLTNRPKREGGKYVGVDEGRVALLIDSMDLAPSCIDIELSTPTRLMVDVLKKARKKGVSVIVSHHDFAGTPEPRHAEKVLKSIVEKGCDIAKLVTAAKSRRDVFKMLEFMVRIQEKNELPVISFAMGNMGKITRYIALVLGSPWIYAGVYGMTAPGQPDLKTAVEWVAELRGLEVQK